MGIILQVFLPISLAVIMFAMGLTLVLDDFKRVLVQPKDFAVGAFGQMILLPAVTFGLVSFWPMDPEFAVAFMILAACPGGVTSNVLTFMARGDTALSISLTAVISLVSVFTIPLITSFALVHFMGAAGVDLPIGETIVKIFGLVTVPVVLGMIVRHFASGFAQRIERFMRHAATALLILIILVAVYSQRATIVDAFLQAGPASLVLNIVMMLIGYYLAVLFRAGRRQRICISLEVGVQNSATAIVIAGSMLGIEKMIIPPGIYGLLMFGTAGLFIYWVTRPKAVTA